jgi:hypothetical protein
MQSRKPIVELYADRSSRRWVARDPEGNFWHLPPTDAPWDDRQPFSPAEETVLEPVPGHCHYLSLFGLTRPAHRAHR